MPDGPLSIYRLGPHLFNDWARNIVLNTVHEQKNNAKNLSSTWAGQAYEHPRVLVDSLQNLNCLGFNYTWEAPLIIKEVRDGRYNV